MLKAFTFALLAAGVGLLGYGLYQWGSAIGYILAGAVLIVVAILFAADATATTKKKGVSDEGEGHVQ